jgi:hypothetical protein
MTILDEINDAIKRGWRLSFEDGGRGVLTITADKTTRPGRTFRACLHVAPGADDPHVGEVIKMVTDDRQIPDVSLAAALVERKRLDPDAPDVIYGPLEMLDGNYAN